METYIYQHNICLIVLFILLFYSRLERHKKLLELESARTAALSVPPPVPFGLPQVKPAIMRPSVPNPPAVRTTAEPVLDSLRPVVSAADQVGIRSSFNDFDEDKLDAALMELDTQGK